VAAELTARKSRRSHAWLASIGGIAALTVVTVSHDRIPEPRPSRIAEPLAPRTVTLEPATWTLLDLAPQRADGQWIHPVAGALEVLPTVHSRRFGAERPGNRPSHCRRGHCGVDLTGPRGTPIVAVLPGTVAHVEESRGNRSGRYVRIEHEDGSSTSYMHLDRIAPDLQVGQTVDAGAMLGTLGRTGIHHSDPHLHFQIEVPRGKYHRFVDPEPMLADAVVIDVLDIELPTVDAEAEGIGDSEGDDGVELLY